MSYVARYLIEKNRQEIASSLRKSKDSNLEFENVSNAKIGNFIQSNQEGGYIHGKIVVKRAYDDYDFELTEDFEIKTARNEITVYDDVNFTIFPDLKIICFTSKDKAALFGMDVLSRIIFGEGGKLSTLAFYPQKVLDSKKKGNFQNVWFNGVRFDGKIGYTGQFGTEIDEDTKFLNNPDKARWDRCSFFQ